MADGFNSMQAQLGLVGQGGSFNPLGLATPPPPAPPMVRHPGDVSTDIVRQTQTQMATTLQTTAAMRMGGMGGMAFGGMNAVGAFAQQYQMNMAGINANHMSPFSAQMMGMMAGGGSGFSSGMLPHPAMMTTPGMGIYRPFMPPQSATVSPFPQMPMFQTPFSPMPPAPMFQTPMELSHNLAIQAGQRRTAAMFATPGVMAHAGTTLGLGMMGGGLGASIGARFGPMGALIGGGLGMAAGAFGSEHFGLSSTAQHMVDHLNPFRTAAIRGQQMMGASQGFVSSGPDLNMMTGRGLSAHGATHLGRLLESTAFSSGFRRETGGMFSAQDLTRITNTAGQQGMLNDAQSVDQIHERVKSVAKSLVSFMKIANEPNVVEALKSMGKMRQMGLSLGETMDMAVEARMYSRMAGMSSRALMESAGAQGAMTFQQQGLSAGLGMRIGMGAMGTAHSAVASGAFTPQRLAMLGGVQGVAQHEMESAAAFLNRPMMTAAMSTIGRGGTFGLDAEALKGMMTGRMDANQMATRGVNNLLGAVGQQGVGALAMAQLQSTEIADSMGRALGPRGVEMAQMNQINAMRKFLGGGNTPGDFVMGAKAGGMSDDQIKVFMGKANSPGYFEDQKRHLQLRRMEMRGVEAGEFERNRPGFFVRMLGDTAAGRGLRENVDILRDAGEGATNFFHDLSQEQELSKTGQFASRTSRNLIMSNDEMRYARDAKLFGAGGGGTPRPGLSGAMNAVLGDRLDTRQFYANKGGLAGALFGGQGGGSALVGDMMAMVAQASPLGNLMATPSEIAKANEATGKADRLIQRGLTASMDERKSAVDALGKGGSLAVMKLADKLAKAADAESGFFPGTKGGKIDPDKQRQLAREALAETGNKNPTEAEIDNAIVAAIPGAKASTKNPDALHPSENFASGADKIYKGNLKDAQESIVNQLYGDTSLFGAERRQKTVEKLFEGEGGDKAGAYAALKAAADNSDDPALKAAAQKMGAQLMDGSPEDRAALRSAERKIEAAKKDNTIEDLRKVGNSLNREAKGDTTATFAAAKAAKNSLIQNKAAAKRNAGLAKLIGGNDADFAGKSGASVLDDLSSSDLGSLPDNLKELVGQYKAESDPVKRQALASKLDELGFDTGTVSETEAKGGFFASTDKAADLGAANITSTQQAMSGMFPESVKTFSEASKALLKAAQKLGGSVDRTSLPNGGTLVSD